MAKIIIPAELYEKLLSISIELNKQDHRGIAMPYFFQIQTEEEILVPEGSGEEKYLFEGDFYTEETIKEYWEDFYSEDLTFEEFKQKYTTLVNTQIEHQYNNAFFTEKACKKHIKENAHHYRNPVDYLNHAFRNPELETILEFLCKLTNGKMHK